MTDLFGEDEENGDLLPEEEEEEEDILDMEGGDVAQQQDALLMRFCPHDSSMLYPHVRMIVNTITHWIYTTVVLV